MGDEGRIDLSRVRDIEPIHRDQAPAAAEQQASLEEVEASTQGAAAQRPDYSAVNEPVTELDLTPVREIKPIHRDQSQTPADRQGRHEQQPRFEEVDAPAESSAAQTPDYSAVNERVTDIDLTPVRDIEPIHRDPNSQAAAPAGDAVATGPAPDELEATAALDLTIVRNINTDTTLREAIRSASKVADKEDAMRVLGAALDVTEVYADAKKVPTTFRKDRSTRLVDSFEQLEPEHLEGYVSVGLDGEAKALNRDETDRDQRTLITDFDKRNVERYQPGATLAAENAGDAIPIRNGNGLAVQEWNYGSAKLRSEIRQGATIYGYSDTGLSGARHQQFYCTDQIGVTITLPAFREKYGLKPDNPEGRGGWTPDAVSIIRGLPTDVPLVTGHATSEGLNPGGAPEAVIAHDPNAPYKDVRPWP